MTVYLDLIILDNFAADFALLYLAVKTARGEVKLWRLALTALAGTALAVGYTVFTLYYTLPPAVEIFVKYGVAALLPVFASKYKKKSTLAIAVGAFLAYMFALAGLLTALFSDPQIEEVGRAHVYDRRRAFGRSRRLYGPVRRRGEKDGCENRKAEKDLVPRRRLFAFLSGKSSQDPRVSGQRQHGHRARRHVRGGGGKSARR